MHVNRGERNGAFALILIGLMALLGPEIYRYVLPNKPTTDFADFEADIEKFRSHLHEETSSDGAFLEQVPSALFVFNPNTASFDDFIRLGLSERTAKSICNYRDKGGKFRKPEDFKKIYTLSDTDYERLLPYIKLGADIGEYADNRNQSSKKELLVVQEFNFDPNTVTEAEMLQLGLPKWVVGRVLNYRAKGGKFRNKEDLSKIYGFPEEDYERLEPFIAIAAVEVSSQPQSYSGGSGGSTNSYPQKNFAPVGPLDINRAAVEHWQMLPGIGEKRAQMIVKYREKLGGFVSIAQVGELRGLPDSVYQRIRPMLVLQFSEPRKLNINALNTQELDAHPYITPRQASLIVADRSQNGNYQKVDDLLRIPVLFDKAWLDKIQPYLDVR